MKFTIDLNIYNERADYTDLSGNKEMIIDREFLKLF